MASAATQVSTQNGFESSCSSGAFLGCGLRPGRPNRRHGSRHHGLCTVPHAATRRKPADEAGCSSCKGWQR